jgi:integrase
MHDADLAPATIRTRVANIRAILYAATRDGLMTDNPAVGVRLPRATGRASSAAMPTANQVERLIASSPAPYNALFALCAYAGLRLGEARALRWDDIDLNRRTLAVRRQLRLTPGGGWETSPPKSESHRTIPIPPELLKMLGERPSDGQKLILEGANGTPLHPGSIHRVWTRQRASCGLPNGLRLHDLRHWFASSLIADGKNILTVQRRLGHTHASTTLDIYAHVLPEREIDVAAFGNVVAGHSR